MVVAWLEALDSFDLSSRFELARETPEVLDLGLSDPDSCSSLSFEAEVLLRLFFSSDTSVSGGLGGRSPFWGLFLLVEHSVDLDLFRLSDPRSVASGVRGS